MRGADLLIQSLSLAGVKTIYTLSGNQIMPLFDACLDANIRLIHTRHEGAAVYMAQAHAQLTGEVGVAMVTAGPGFTNALGPLLSSIKSESAVLLLSGDSPTEQDGRGAFQEIDQVAVSKGLTKYAERIVCAQKLGSATANAVQAALSGTRGPVHLALPANVLLDKVSETDLPAVQDFEPRRLMPNRAEISHINEAIESANKPLIVLGPVFCAGAGTANGATTALREQLEQSLKAPALLMESPRGLNDPALGAFAAAASEADLVVSLGKAIDFTTGFGRLLGPAAKLMMVSPATETLEQARQAVGDRLAMAIAADPVLTSHELAQFKSQRSDHWLIKVREIAAARSWQPDKDSPPAKHDDAMHPGQLCAAIQPILDSTDDVILIIDGGEFGQWAQAGLTAPTRLINGPSGAIGGGLCYALAAKAVRPDANVVVLMGDGTIGFHLAELETAHRLGLAITVIVGHDASWNAEVQIQKREFGLDRQIACDLSATRYDQVAIALGCEGEYVTDAGSLVEALSRALGREGPTCLNVPIQALAAPQAPSLS
ncbi:MAG: thiamine pyrophosphate-binding protein [Burkholderiaceae bacterium]